MSAVFQGSTAIVVGGSSGIGRAVGVELARAGSTVLFAGRSEDALREVTDEVRAFGGSALYQAVDVKVLSSVQRLVQTARERAGRVDYMFNSAGTGMLAYAEDTDAAHYEEMIATNLMGTIHCAKAVYPEMKRQGRGHIVNVASLAGLVPMPASTAYCAVKFGVVGFTQALRLEAREFGVRVSVVCPGAVDTPIVRRATCINIDGAKWAATPPPGGILDPARCARDILDGIRLNRGVIYPGAAGAIAALARYFPFLWQAAGLQVAKKLRGMRTRPAVNAPSA